MEIHYPKLRNMTHALSLSVFIASKGTNFYIFIPNGLNLRKKHKNRNLRCFPDFNSNVSCKLF